MSDEKPRQYTKEECLDMLMDHMQHMVTYWENLPNQTTREKLEGLLFSFYTAIDGSSMNLPAFDLIPSPHEEDEEFLKSEGSNWWPCPSAKDSKIINKYAINQLHMHDRMYAKKKS